MSGEPLLSVAEALARVLSSARTPLETEQVTLADALGRTLAADLIARRTQPPFAASAMDGYAVRAEDLEPPRHLKIVGESAAGHGFSGVIVSGEATRIFTGAPLPAGADTILIQENARRDGDRVFPLQSEARGRFVRPAGMDFTAGSVLLRAGTRLGPRQITLAAAMNHAVLPVSRRPKVAILANGDELVRPGETPGPDQIIASNSFGLSGIITAAGGLPIDLGIAPDRREAIAAAFAESAAAGADILVTIGGASVGDHDLVRAVATAQGADLSFYRIAMRPGKPLNFGHLGPMRLLGLPGNPVSAVICGLLFLRPLIRALAGDPAAAQAPLRPARLGAALPANDQRQDYLRARIAEENGVLVASAAPNQDSSLISPLAAADGLILRLPHAPAAPRDGPCEVILFADLGI